MLTSTNFADAAVVDTIRNILTEAPGDLASPLQSPAQGQGGEATSFASKDFLITDVATAADKALDAKYGYGTSTPGNTFGWQANLSSAKKALEELGSQIDAGNPQINLEKVAAAVHRGWAATAKKFITNPRAFSDVLTPEKIEQKKAARKALADTDYAQLPNDEKEKDRVIARVAANELKRYWSRREADNDDYRPGIPPTFVPPALKAWQPTK